MDHTTERLLEIVTRQTERLERLEAQLEALAPPEPEELEPVRDVPWSELTHDEKVRLTAQKYG